MQYGQTVIVLRRMLVRIRDALESEHTAQTRLARIVSIIAEDMAAEACSIYVIRRVDPAVLELFTAHGLPASAVRRTRFRVSRVSKSLIGKIAATARPLTLSDVQNRPAFVYRPQTGEENYHSLMGVPILRGGGVVGVLAVQNVSCRQYTEEEIEALQTVALVLAEVVAGVSLLLRQVVYHSCFISYSSMDQDFAERLRADLRKKGINCWLASHDLPIGAKIWDTIDEAIQLQDKLLLIFSENSIASDWVEDEVNKAFAEERRRNDTILFPVRLDDTVFTTSEPWAVKLRDQRHIGDFTQWKEYDAYRNSFKQVLKSLEYLSGLRGSEP